LKELDSEEAMALFSLLLKLLVIKACLIHAADMDCCYKKENDGSRYVLMAEENTAEYNCDSNCVYSKDSEPESRYCFKKSGNIPSTCLHEKSPIKTQFIREEGNETVVQDNHYYGDTGIITMTVPPHKHYDESVLMLHQDSRLQMLKTGGVCQLSEMPDHFDVHEIHNEFEKQARKRNPVVREADTKKVHTLKMRMSPISARQISELHHDLAHLCKGHPILKTSDVIVDEETWEKHNNGEIVFLNERSSRDSRDPEPCLKPCCLDTGVTARGPGACGAYGFTNPDPNGQSFSAHQISNGVLHVKCIDSRSTFCPQEDRNTYCECTDIDNECTLTKCVVTKKDITTTIETIELDENIDVTQRMQFWSLAEGSALQISADNTALDFTGDVVVVMNSQEKCYWHQNIAQSYYADPVDNNWLMKVGETCYLSTLPKNVFPVDWALDIAQIPPTTAASEEIMEYAILVIKEGDMPTDGLYPKIKDICNSRIKTFEYFPYLNGNTITEEQATVLSEGRTILVTINNNQMNVKLPTDVKSGSWRYPNSHGPDMENGQKLWIHQIVLPVIKV